MVDVIASSFSVNLKVLKAFFLYTPQEKNEKKRSYLMFSLFMFHVPVFGVLYFILEKNIDRQRMSDNGFVLAEMCCYIPKLLPFVVKADQIKKCIHYFEKSSVELRPNQRAIIDKASKICRRNSLIFIVCMTGGFLSWASKPLFMPENRLPIDIWLPVDVESDLKIYCAVYVWVVLGAAYPAIASAAIEPLIAGLACLAAAYLSVLKDNLQYMHRYSEEECPLKNVEVNWHKNRAIFQEIQKCIKHHYVVLNFAKLYEDCFSQVVFSQFVGSIFVLGFCCLQLSMVNIYAIYIRVQYFEKHPQLEPLSVNFMSTLSYLGVLLAQIYFYCYYGTRLFEESNSLTNAAYMGEWYEFDAKSKKALILLMERSKRPIVITAGKMLDLSLVTFTTILRRSYSLLAVLNNQ